MIAGKESLIELEEVAKQQHQIYGDACDFGIISTPRMRVKIRAACEDLREIYKGKAERWHGGSSWSCFIPYEQEDGLFCGVKVCVSFNKDAARKLEFFTIDITSNTQEENPFRGE